MSLLLPFLVFAGHAIAVAGEASAPLPAADAAELAALRRLVDEWRPSINELVFRGEREAGEAPSRFVVLAVSPTPDPVASPYADCLIALKLAPFPGTNGASAAGSIVGLAWGFRARSKMPPSQLVTGDVVRCVVIPAAYMGKGISSLQRIDTVEDFELPICYVASLSKEDARATRRIRVGPPADIPPYYATQALAISNDLAQLRARAAAHGGWDAWFDSLAPIRQELQRKLKQAGGPLVRDDRQFFGSVGDLNERPKPEWEAPVKVIASLARQLGQRGIDLIVIPVPSKEHVNGHFFLDRRPDDLILNPYRNLMHTRLLEAGIEVIDLQPALVAAWERFPHVFYDALDTHPADGAIQVAAEAVAQRLARYKFPASRNVMCMKTTSYGIPVAYERFRARSRLPCAYMATGVYGEDGSSLSGTRLADAPAMLLCDSFGGVPRSYGVPDASMAFHMARWLGCLPRVVEVGGGAPGMLVHLGRASPAAFRDVDVTVFMFHERYLFMHDDERTGFCWTDALLGGGEITAK